MANDETMWMVRAGEGARLLSEFLKDNIVAIGWNETGDLSKASTAEEIKQIVKEKYPDFKSGKLNISAGQISRFRFNFEKGHNIVTYDPEKRTYYIGEILSDYEYNTKVGEYHHIRRVRWLGEISRDKLSTPTKNTLGAISTIFKVSEDATKEIIELLEGEEVPEEDIESAETELDTIKEDMIAKAREFIKDKILKLDWDEAEDLVAGILRGMGYKTRMLSKKGRGSDGGRDVLASPDGLGLEDPRIIAEVKHRSAKIGSDDIDRFRGALQQSNSKGLYVSTGGFTKGAHTAAQRLDIPLTLINLDQLADLVIQYYDNFDEDTKALIPLTKIYWPTSKISK